MSIACRVPLRNSVAVCRKPSFLFGKLCIFPEAFVEVAVMLDRVCLPSERGGVNADLSAPELTDAGIAILPVGTITFPVVHER